MTKYTILVNLLIVCFTANAETDYCELSCESYEQTVCYRGTCELNSTTCGSNSSQINLTSDDVAFILELHNSLRQKVATGNETTGDQPPASNMSVLAYNDELAYVAQCWTNNCVYAHDKCRSTANYSWVGQNLGILMYKGTLGDYQSVINSTILEWYNEVDYFNSSWVSNYSSHTVEVSHYTQLVWAATEEIGCGMTFYVEDGWNSYLFACNYGPGGNVIGSPVYEIGEAASDCPDNIENTEYPGLCGY